MEPRRIASYILLEPLGHGGMAVVYRARQESLDRTVAVKVLSENLAASTEFMERFRREARTAANLRHPNVITVHDFGEDERGVPYLVLEYIEGPTLADLMDVGLDDSRIPDLLDQIAAGLDYAHAHGVIHRDIKPGNVLTTEDGRVVLADFGLAWLLEGAHLTMTGGVIGTQFTGDETNPSGVAAMFDLRDGLTLALYGRADLAKDANVPLGPPKTGEFSLGCLVASRADVDAVLARAEAAGATRTDQTGERPWGIYSGYFRDPDGHLWEIIWDPGRVSQDAP